MNNHPNKRKFTVNLVNRLLPREVASEAIGAAAKAATEVALKKPARRLPPATRPSRDRARRSSVLPRSLRGKASTSRGQHATLCTVGLKSYSPRNEKSRSGLWLLSSTTIRG